MDLLFALISTLLLCSLVILHSYFRIPTEVKNVISRLQHLFERANKNESLPGDIFEWADNITILKFSPLSPRRKYYIKRYTLGLELFLNIWPDSLGLLEESDRVLLDFVISRDHHNFTTTSDIKRIE